MIPIDPLRHHPLVIDGDRVGDVVSLGLRVVFYTTDGRLKDLDGQHFAGFESARAAVCEALTALEVARQGSRQRPWRAPPPAAAPKPRAVAKTKAVAVAFSTSDTALKPFHRGADRSGH